MTDNTPAEPSDDAGREAREKALLALERAARKIASTRKAADDAFEQARAVAIEAISDGIVSEHEAARILGLNRMTIRAWLGKPHRPPKSPRS